tara:strand:- start:55 stop:672 length:618 start_codon:yes stop_codon:yes gene_type:complete
MFDIMQVPFGFKDWLRGPTTPETSYLVRFRAGCPPIGCELRRRGSPTNEEGKESGMCLTCTNIPETRAHFLLECPAYSDARQEMLDACKGVVSQEDWQESMELTPERRTLWLLSGCRTLPSVEETYTGLGIQYPWERDCSQAIAKYIKISLKKRYAIVPQTEDTDSDSSDSEFDSSDDDLPLVFLCSKHQTCLAGSMASATASNT